MKAQNRGRIFGGATGKTTFKTNGGKGSLPHLAVPAAQTKKSGGRIQPEIRPLNGGSPKHFPVVGIGASAGGLEAFTQLLQNLPADTGMAFILVQHLDPDHQSALTQILTRTTSMQVREVTHGMAVAPNHVYVIPPNTCMEIAKGVLKLRPRSNTPGAHRSIDVFFESLAQDQRERAIGVILSGTATDGTQGLEMIKAEGGITLAQDDSAKYDSMPRSAVAAGCVDLVLSPKKIANELARIAKHPSLAHATQDGDANSANESALPARGVPKAGRGEETALNPFKKILLLLRNHRGVDFSLYKPATIQRRITRRMVLNKQNSLGDYPRFLKGNLKELDLLYSDILISVTSFFRNPEAFEALKLKVFPDLLRYQRQDDPVRVWTLGCSTGQEAYSIAMAFTEFCDKTPRAPKLQVFATDLNETLLEKARHGLYSKNLVADVSPERLRRFFVEEQGGYRVCKPMRELCVFARQNVLNDPPFSRMDLISCRNLMIYIEPGLQKKILPNFHYALKPGGFLFLGASESIGAFTHLFDPADKKQKIFSKKPGSTLAYHLPVKGGRSEAGRKVPAPPHSAGLRQPAQPSGQTETLRIELNAQREADRLMVNQFAPPSVLINANLEVLQFRGQTSAFLEPPSGKASFNVLKMARAGLMLPLRAVINKAKKEKNPASRKNVRIEDNGRSRLVNIEVIPLNTLKERCYLILFEKGEKVGRTVPAAPSRQDDLEQRTIKRPLGSTRALPKKEESRRIAELERELAEARDYAQSLQEQHEAANEELQAANEEGQSANEELQSVNEELETSKEELESTNEELTTVNEEMANRNTELNRLNSDLTNLQTSTKLPVVLLGRDLSIRRFSPQAEKQFNLVATDVGRPFGHIRHNLVVQEAEHAVRRAPRRAGDAPQRGGDATPRRAPDLETYIAEVIASVRERECEVRDNQGNWYFLHVRPYMTVDNKVDGAILVLADITSVKESEQAVAAARNFAEAIIRTARDPFLILDANLRVERANDAFYTTFKVTPAESVGRTVFELDHGHWDIPKLRELLEDILPRHSFFNNFEVTHDFENIGYRTMLLNARTLSETTGQPARVLLGIQDISELLHFQAQMRRSELRFRRLFEAGKDGVLIIDPETRKILDANPYMTDLLGYPHEALLGKELFEIGLLKDEEASRMAFQELKKKGFIRYENLPLVTTTGRRREVEFVSNLYQEGDGKVIQCNIRDMTERKKAEQELSEKARLLDLSNDAILVRDFEGKILYWNRGAEELYGWSREEALGKTSQTLLQTGYPTSLEQITSELHRNNRWTGELVHTKRNGQRITVHVRKVLDRDSQGNPSSVLENMTDITERKQMEDKLSRAHALLSDRAGHLEQAVIERTEELTTTNKQLEAFVYSIAHDLRAPLRSMQGFSAMLVEETGAAMSEAGRDFANRINKSAQFMDALLQDLLAFSAIAQQRVELTSVNLEGVVQFVLTSLEKDIQENKASVETVGPWPNVLGHDPTLGQVLVNLVNNALKFVAPNVPPLVRLRTEEKEEFIRVWVEDNGIGIVPDHQDQVFKLFTRLHGGKYPGTGIGLAIVEKGIERMGGRVGVESAPGQGSRFWFELKKA